MPKGIKSSGLRIPEKLANLIVPVGAKTFPNSISENCPEGITLPEGIRVRTEKSVEIRFILDGKRITETVKGTPTVRYIEEIAHKRDRIVKLISLGKFDHAAYAEEFPESVKAKARRENEQDQITIGQALDEWFVIWKGDVGVNSERDARLAIKHQIKTFKFADGTFPKSLFVRPPYDEELAEQLSLPHYLGGPSRAIDPDDFQILANLPVSALTDIHICSIREAWLAEGKSAKRINNMIGYLSKSFARLLDNKRISASPFATIKSLKAKKNRGEKSRAYHPSSLSDDCDSFEYDFQEKADPFTPEELVLIYANCTQAWANQLNFEVSTGLRTGELIALRTNDVDWDKNRICVRRSLSRDVLKDTKTGKARWVDLSQVAIQALKAQIELLEAPDGWLFPNPNTKQRWSSANTLNKRWTTILARAGVRYRRFYQLRHTYGSMMLSAGENVLYVAGQMGHTDWTMLLKVYARWLPSESHRPGEKVANANANLWSALSASNTFR